MYKIWAITGIIFLLLDLKSPNKYKLAFCSSFLFSAIVAFKFPQNYNLQIVSFAIFALVFSYLIRIIFEKEQRDYKKEKKLDDYINKDAIVTKDIGKTLSIDGIGYIEYNGEIWGAKSVDDKEIKKGQLVKIVSRENRIMNVKVVDYANK